MTRDLVTQMKRAVVCGELWIVAEGRQHLILSCLSEEDQMNLLLFLSYRNILFISNLVNAEFGRNVTGGTSKL